MLQFEDILDDAARYLRGEMDPDERAFFEELLNQYPYLWDDLRLMQLVQEGLKEMHEPGNSNPANLTAHSVSTTGRLARKKNRVLLILSAVLFLLILFFFALWMKRKTTASKPEPEQQASTVQVTRPSSPSEYIRIDQIGGENAELDFERGQAIRWLSEQEVAFAGSVAGQSSLGTSLLDQFGQGDVLFGRYNCINGTFGLVKTFGGLEKWDLARGLAVDSRKNLILTGSIGGTVRIDNQTFNAGGQDDVGRNDLFIAKFDSSGAMLWLRHSGGRREKFKQTGLNTGKALAVDTKDNILVAGFYVGSPELTGFTLPVGGPNEDLFLAKYSPAGQIKWVQTATCEYMIFPNDIALDAAGNIFLCGTFGHHNLGGNAFFGKDTLRSFGGKDIFLAKYSPEGNLLWLRQAGSAQKQNGYDGANGIAVDEQGNLVITGYFQDTARFGNQSLVSSGGMDIFVAKYNTRGELLWARHAGGAGGSGPNPEQGFDVALDPMGGIYITGVFSGTARFEDEVLSTSGDCNFFFAKYAPSGDLEWVIPFEPGEGFLRAEGRSIDISPNGNIAVTGSFSGAISIGGIELRSKGREDVFILLFNEKGKLLSAQSMVAYM